MKKTSVLVILLLCVQHSFCQLDSTGLNNLFGKKGSVQGGVYKITFPRTDLKVTIGDFKVAPGLALTCWIGFLQMGHTTMMMGDLVLQDSEVQKAVAEIVKQNLQVTAIHNHVVMETPAIKYIHFSGEGNALELGQRIKNVLSVTGTPLTAPATTQTAQAPDWTKVTAILGTSGKQNGMLLQYGFPRKEKLLERGMEMPPAIGMATAINFQMDGDRAGITGDFVLLADEVNPVFKALLENGITPTAIHNHMLYDEPRLFMMHFWAVGDPAQLAKGLKVALGKTNSKL